MADSRSAPRLLVRLCLAIIKTILYLAIAMAQILWYMIDNMMRLVLSLIVPGERHDDTTVIHKTIDITSDTFRVIVNTWVDVFRD